ncbi:Uncharacterised protein [Yersinia massiliensis]|nr:Uncharacterised protein [Yersinia massiliensis]
MAFMKDASLMTESSNDATGLIRGLDLLPKVERFTPERGFQAAISIRC